MIIIENYGRSRSRSIGGEVWSFANSRGVFGYKPVYSAHVGNGSRNQSLFALSRNASMVSASQESPHKTKVEYLRIAKRDNPRATSPLSVKTGTSNKGLTAQQDQGVNLQNTDLGYISSSTARVIVTKNVPISAHEAAEMTDATAEMTMTCTMVPRYRKQVKNRRIL